VIYPEVLLLPILMLSDYYLTIFSYVLFNKKYSEYVRFEQYELNPRFQKAINKKEIINVKHLCATLIITGFAIYIAEISPVPHEFVSVILGCLLTIFSVVVGRHIANILLFVYVIKNPNTIKGKIEYTYEATIFISMFYSLIPLIALIIICIYERSLFALGSILGIGSLILAHFRFLKKMKQKKSKMRNPDSVGIAVETDSSLRSE